MRVGKRKKTAAKLATADPDKGLGKLIPKYEPNQLPPLGPDLSSRSSDSLNTDSDEVEVDPWVSEFPSEAPSPILRQNRGRRIKREQSRVGFGDLIPGVGQTYSRAREFRRE
jgi:hypothetical protein